MPSEAMALLATHMLPNITKKKLPEGNLNGPRGKGHQRRDKLPLLLRDGDSTISSTGMSPDKKALVILWDNNILFWNMTADITADIHITTLARHTNVCLITFSRNSQYLALALDDKTIEIWDVFTGRCKHMLAGHNDSIYSIAFSPDGEHLASASWDRAVKVWCIKTGRCDAMRQGHGDFLYSLAFSSDSRHLALTSNDHILQFRDITAGCYDKASKGRYDSIVSGGQRATSSLETHTSLSSQQLRPMDRYITGKLELRLTQYQATVPQKQNPNSTWPTPTTKDRSPESSSKEPDIEDDSGTLDAAAEAGAILGPECAHIVQSIMALLDPSDGDTQSSIWDPPSDTMSSSKRSGRTSSANTPFTLARGRPQKRQLPSTTDGGDDSDGNEADDGDGHENLDSKRARKTPQERYYCIFSRGPDFTEEGQPGFACALSGLELRHIM